MTTIYTVGHGRHSAEHFAGLLQGHAISVLVDVRSHPVSKWSPQFGKAALSQCLAALEVRYLFLGRELGGRPPGAEFYGADGSVDYARRATAPDFQAGVERLARIARVRRTVILCAEEDPSHCHRRLLVTPALRVSGLHVLHVRGDGRLEPDEAYAPRDAQLRLFPAEP